MSRELKFRIYDKTSGYYVAILDNDCFDIKQVARIILELEMLKPEYIIDQYTGLTDKNGKEIYEGDIVKWLDGLNEYVEFKVEWQENCASFCLRNEYSVFDYEELSDKKKPFIEVIGNIHENPELLGGKE